MSSAQDEITNIENEKVLQNDVKDGAAADPRMDASTDSSGQVTGSRLFVIHVGLCVCTFLVGLDFTLIALAVPSITSRFNSIGDIGWYGGAFYIALSAPNGVKNHPS
ncbi:hypothetical protein ACLMJK_002821 [Lecanora helva]